MKIGDKFRSFDWGKMIQSAPYRNSVMRKADDSETEYSREDLLVFLVQSVLGEIAEFAHSSTHIDLARMVKEADKIGDKLCQMYRMNGIWAYDGNPIRYIFCQELIRQNGTAGIQIAKDMCSRLGWDYRKCTMPEEFERKDGYSFSFMIYYLYSDELEPYEYPALFHLDTKVKVGDEYKTGNSIFTVTGFDVEDNKFILTNNKARGYFYRTESQLKEWEKV